MSRHFHLGRIALSFVLAAFIALPAFADSDRSSDSSRQGRILSMRPLAYWPLDEAGSSVVNDRTGHGNDGFFEGARGGAPGSKPGKYSVLFAGFPGINLNDTEVAIQGNAPRTMIAWILTFASDPQAILSTGLPGGDGAVFNLVVGYGACPSLGVMRYNDDFYPCGRSLNDGNWHMVAATYDKAGMLKLYVDGTLDASTSTSYDTFGQNNFIGRSNHWGFERIFQGYIDDVAIFDRALTAREIAVLAGT